MNCCNNSFISPQHLEYIKFRLISLIYFQGLLNRQVGGGLGEDFIKRQVKAESNKLLNRKCNAE